MHAEILEQSEAAFSDVQERSILVIEDDRGIADVLVHRLGKQGYQTRVAMTGCSGFEMAMLYQPNLILLDLRLPDIDGFQVCQKLEEQSETCQIPVIILSGMEKPDIIRRSRTAGCSYFLRKPYDPNALLLLIENAIQETDDY